MDPKIALGAYKQKVDIELRKYLLRKQEEYRAISEFAVQFIQDLAELTLRGGKRLRPALIYYSYKLFGGEKEEEIIRLSIFIELLQSFLLIHDDLLDRALLRRGGPTIHKTYERYSKEHKFIDDEHFGYTMGLLSGDLAGQFAIGIIGESNFDSDKKNNLTRLVYEETTKVIFGQILDVLLTYPCDYTEKDVYKVHWYKTATYTYKLPLFTGAILADATEEELEALEKFAMPSGVAFQIRDDILGVFGKSEITGKETKGDIIEGKKTLLVTEAYKNADRKQKEVLDKYLGKKDLSDSEAEEIRVVFRETGALDYSKKECERQIQKAMLSLVKLKDKNKEAYNFLEGIANYMIVRNF